MTNKNRRLTIIAAEFDKELVDEMIGAAAQEARDAGAVLVDVVRVSGCYEIPLIADLHLAQDRIDALVILGYIERGETQHGEVMGHVVHQALVQLQLKHRKPIGLGIIGPGAIREQAEARKTDYARAAVRAALQNCELVMGS
jgi:6,7-dimethyl-8-ribityllumazine synthase